MDGDHPSLSRCVVSFSFMVCSGHHIFLRLLSLLRVMNISPSQKITTKKTLEQLQAPIKLSARGKKPGRCSGSNQVRSVPSPSDGGWTIPLYSTKKREKKSGSDGFPYEFFSQIWEVLGPELLAVLQDAFQAQQGISLPTSMTQGVITLRYKGKGSKALMDSYRPITLLSSDYKLLAKALTTRFGPVLQHVVDPTQTAFVPGRWIGANVLGH